MGMKSMLILPKNEYTIFLKLQKYYISYRD